MKAEERKELETNALAAGAQKLLARAKSGRLVNPYVVAVVLAVALGVGLWLYLSSENRKLGSKQWADLTLMSKTNSQKNLEEFANDHKDSAAARAARLDAARIQLGQEGIGKLNVRDRELRGKAVENVEKARDELLKLADEYKGDPTMQTTCLLAAAEGELALVGIPKTADSKDYRGSVTRAADLYRKAAEAIGDKTPAAEPFKKRADELVAKKDEIERLGDTLNRLVNPPAVFPAFPTPGGPTPGGPKLPDGPITPPKPPEGVGPKAPETITPPPVTPSTPSTNKGPAPTAPAPTPSTKK
jgi:hypothetical protein